MWNACGYPCSKKLITVGNQAGNRRNAALRAPASWDNSSTEAGGRHPLSIPLFDASFRAENLLARGSLGGCLRLAQLRGLGSLRAPSIECCRVHSLFFGRCGGDLCVPQASVAMLARVPIPAVAPPIFPRLSRGIPGSRLPGAGRRSDLSTHKLRRTHLSRTTRFALAGRGTLALDPHGFPTSECACVRVRMALRPAHSVYED